MVDLRRFKSSQGDGLRHHLDSEIRVMMSVKHRNIVTLRDSIMANGYILYMILEFCDSGDMASYLKKKGRLSEQEALYFMQQLGILESSIL